MDSRWQHLVAWELRYALRRSSFWLMLVACAALPPLFGWVLARAYGQAQWLLLAPACGGQMVLLSALVAAWTVLSAKRQVSSELSDDWLLVITWRQSLLARYVVAALLGLAMASASLIVMHLAIGANGTAGSACALQSQTSVFGAVLQGVASAAIVVAASDFLLASQATVISVQLAFTLFWSFVPYLGFFWPAWMMNDTLTLGTPGQVAMLGRVPAVACLLLFGFAWLRSEDFWRLIEQRRRRGDTNIGQIRNELATSQTAHQTGLRLAMAASRERWRGRRVPAWLAVELARYPMLSLPRGPGRWGRLLGLLMAVGTLLVCYVGYQTAAGKDVELDGLFFRYFGWYVAAAIILLRALSSGVDAVARERERGTLAALVIAPLGLRRLLDGKVLAVLLQTAPWAVLLVAWTGGELDLPFWIVVPWLVTGAVLATGCGALFRSRLLAILAAGALGLAVVLLATGSVLDLAREALQPAALGVEVLPLTMLADLAWLPVLWFVARQLAHVALRRQAGHT